MQSFTFNGKSSLDILNEELFLCEFESSTNLPTNTREIIKGETNSYRNVANYFGTKDSDSLQLPIGFVKISGKSFSIYERDIIEGWLTDNEIPKPLVITDKNGKTSVFNGIVTSYEWHIVGKFVIGLSMIFECDSKYWYESVSNESEINSYGYYVLDNKSKEQETYPFISVENLREADTIFKIKNEKDDNYFEIKIKGYEVVSFDSSLCMITSGQSYSDLGLDDCEYIYWPKLYRGKNLMLCCGGDFKITTKFKNKKLGLGSYFGDVLEDDSENRKYAEISGSSLIINGIGNLSNESIIVTGTISSGSINL